MKDTRAGLSAGKTSSGTSFKKEGIITVVSGLPRSGTSMMMKMLDMGNMPLLIDNIRTADTDNPRGYYEFEPVKTMESDNSWLEKARGRAVKIVSPLLEHLALDVNLRYKIIFMIRKIDEVLASQRKMVERLNKGGDAIKDNTLKQNYASHLDKTKKLLAENKHIDVIYINYSDVISDPLEVSETVSRFLGTDLNTEKMAMAIDQSLYRQRIHNTGEGPDPACTEDEAIAERLKHLGYL